MHHWFSGTARLVSAFALCLVIVQAAHAGGLRLLGPSSLGYADPRSGLILTANAA